MSVMSLLTDSARSGGGGIFWANDQTESDYSGAADLSGDPPRSLLLSGIHHTLATDSSEYNTSRARNHSARKCIVNTVL